MRCLFVILFATSFSGCTVELRVGEDQPLASGDVSASEAPMEAVEMAGLEPEDGGDLSEPDDSAQPEDAGPSPPLLDPDFDGLEAALETALGTDPNNPDTDGDGRCDGPLAVAGVCIAGEDADGDGVVDPDETDPLLWDSDLDTVSDFAETNGLLFGPDTDGDGLIDARDDDSDGDGVQDSRDGVVDVDFDGVGCWRDEDDDGDGIPTRREHPPSDLADGEVSNGHLFGIDVDGDGILTHLDQDSDGDGLLDAEEGEGDEDGDQIPAFLDAIHDDGPKGDPDQDGVSTEDELAQGTNPLANEEKSLGEASTEVDTRTGGGDDPSPPSGPSEPSSDRDRDGITNDVEVEVGTDTDDADSDGDGIPDTTELGETPETAPDSDGDGLIDALDDDSDGDGISDALEGADDSDGDDTPDYLDDDSDGDGAPDAEEGPGDADADGRRNFEDPDDLDGPNADFDDDGLSNVEEFVLGTDPTRSDSDGDGVDDGDEVGAVLFNPTDSDGDGLIDALDAS